MATRNIKGITVDIGGNTEPLAKALKDVDNQSRNLQKELKQVEKLLKLDPTNTELLAQKQKLLGEAVKVAGDRLAALRSAQQQVNEQFRQGKVGEEQYRAIQREVISAENHLKSLEKQISNTNTRWQAAAKELEQFGSKTEVLGKKLLPVSAAAGAAVVGITALAVKAGQTADDLNTLAKQTGLTTEQLQKFKYASDLIDVPLETFTGSLSRLTRSMRDARDGNDLMESAFRKLGVRVTDNQRRLRDNEDVFHDLIDALGRVRNEAERDALSMQIFGRSAQDLNPLILGGSEALKKYGEEAEKMGLILSQETLDEMNAFNDELDRSKAQLSAATTQLGGVFAQALLPVIQALTSVLRALIGLFQKLDPGVAKVVVVILSLVAATVPLLITIGKVSTGISAVIGLMAKMGPATAIVKAGLAALTGPIGIVIAAIAALITIGVLVIKNWDKIKDAAKAAWTAIVDLISGVVDKIKGFFTSLIDKGKEIIQRFKNIGKDIIEGLWEGIKSMGTWIKDKVSGFFSGLVGGIKKLLGIASPSKVFADQIGANMAAGIGEGFSKQMGAVSRAIGKELDGMVKGVAVPASIVSLSGFKQARLVSNPVTASTDEAGTVNHYHVAPGAVVIPAKDLKEMRDVTEMLDRLPQAARARGAR